MIVIRNRLFMSVIISMNELFSKENKLFENNYYVIQGVSISFV